MALDKYSRLKIASNVLDEPVTSMAESWNVTLQTVKGVCDGSITSARIEKRVDEKIDEAERIYDKYRSSKLTANQQ